MTSSITIKHEDIAKLSLNLFIGLFFVLILPYLFFWGNDLFSEIKFAISILLEEGLLSYLWYFLKGYLIFVGLLFAGFMLHEVIHALTFSFFVPNKFRAIKFGIMTKPLTPFVHCKEKISIWGYRIGVIMPGLLLGLIPTIIGLINGSFGYFLFGIILTMGASGDLMLLWRTKELNSTSKIMDHPEEIGFMVLK